MSRMFLVLVLSCCCACTAQPVPSEVDSPAHHSKTGFTNPYIEEPDKSFFSFLTMRFFGDEQWADHQALASQVPVEPVQLERIASPQSQLQVTWLGHSMFLIQYQGKNILTDPIFSDRASPLSFAGPKRYIPHVMDYKDLPPIDAVVISHSHYDHLDLEAVEQLAKNSHFFVPLKLKQWFLEQDISAAKVSELDWWQSQDFNGISFQALPSQHWSARGLGDRFATLWSSWSITIGDKHLWFAGDTGYNPVQFRLIGERIAAIDLAMIPIGAYAPRWFMQPYHVNPQEAVQIHQDVGARKSIGMHWGTFPLTAEEPGEPPIKLEQAKQNSQIDPQAFISMAVGQTLIID
jgi:N-acyl-phosphatidylethanolamine-hydrolysing phospholipase D